MITGFWYKWRERVGIEPTQEVHFSQRFWRPQSTPETHPLPYDNNYSTIRQKIKSKFKKINNYKIFVIDYKYTKISIMVNNYWKVFAG